MSRIARVLVVACGLLALLLGLMWVAGRPPDRAGSATPAEAPPSSASTVPAAAQTPLPSAGPVAAASVSPEASARAAREDTASDPGDPLENDAPTRVPPGPAATAMFENPRRAHLTFQLDLENAGPGAITRLDVFIPIPQARYNQAITNVSFSAPYRLVTDRFDEEIAAFRFEDLAAGEKVRLSWEGDVEIWAMDLHLDPDQTGSLADIPPDIARLYTADEEKYRLASPVVQNAARSAAAGATNPYWIARNIHDYVARRLRYRNDGQWADAETVYRQAEGSCSEYSFLFIALARANGLPARYVAGTRQRQEGTYVDTLFHRWTEVYLPPYGWVPVDSLHDDKIGGPYTDFFGAISDERFATTVSGGDSDLLGWNYHYGFRYDYEGDRPELKRSRRFIWEP